MVESYTVADFFCGAGGFSEGFNQEGFKIVFSLDNWKPAKITHDFNFPDCDCKLMNILELDTPEKIDEIIPDTDIIIGSPPCVSFSNSNKSGKADKTLGVKLINQYLKIILHKKTKPNSKLKYWILENVPNSIDHIKDEYTAEELGLNEDLPNLVIKNKAILIASDYGAPQGRKRTIAGDYIIPPKTHDKNPVTIDVIQKALGPPQQNKKKIIKDPLFDIKTKKKELTDHFYDSTIPESLWKKAQRLKTDHGYMGKMQFPDSTNRLCRTIMATESFCARESIIFAKEDGEGYRAPTIRELASLMGFPTNFHFVGTSANTKHKQIGNAVCVQLSQALARAIKEKDQLYLAPPPMRKFQNPSDNLNLLEHSLLANYSPKPKKMNSKFHIHVPNIKVDQLRVELSNLNSDFQNEQYQWQAILHKGSGKNATSTEYSNSLLEAYISTTEHFNDFTEKLHNKMNGNTWCSLTFQKKNCMIACDDESHLSPIEVLEYTRDIIQNYNMAKDDYLYIPELDKLLNIPNAKKYHLAVLYSLYALNAVVKEL
jgi:DNA (cytosine-5)-methyltransferase 1